AGNPGWDYDTVLRSFVALESNERGASEYHGAAGEQNVADLRSVNPVSRAFVEAGVEIGLARNRDFNGAAQEGVGFYQVTQKRGARYSAAAAFLVPILSRPNLEVITDAHATSVIVERGRAVGVRYVKNGHPEEARA